MDTEPSRGSTLVPFLVLESAQGICLLDPIGASFSDRDAASRFAATRCLLGQSQDEGQILHLQHGTSGERDTALDDVLQLTHVAGLVVLLQREQRASGNAA